jgi:hypothetical protein
MRAAPLAVLAGLAVALVVMSVPAARADGDPASDVLYFQDAYLPYPPPSKHAAGELRSALRAARSRQYDLKVAVIATRTDLGSIPSLYGKPAVYAQFLGEEIRSFYTGPLLVAMPAGFGIWKGGADTTAEQHVLAGVKLHASAVDELVLSAAVAVRRLAGLADVPSERDRRSPRVHALAAAGRAGKPIRLRYRVGDNSGRSREAVRVYGANYVLYANVVSPMERASRSGWTLDSVLWRAPSHLDEKKLRFCVLARDPAGNASRVSCAAVRVRA